MRAVFVLAGLTIKEAIRRRVFVAGLLIAALFLASAFLPLHIQPSMLVGDTMPEARENTGRILAWVGCGIIKFFSSVLAVTLAAGALTTEVERGVLSVVVSKPLPRAAIYVGRWLGLLTLLAVNIAIWAGLLVFAIWHHTQTFHPRIFEGILAACLFPLLFTTLTLFFSSFATFALSAGLSLIAAGVALAEDLLHTLSLPPLLNAPVLDTLSHVAGYVVPLSKMNHWITRGLGEAGFDLSALTHFVYDSSKVATTRADMTYILCYIVFFFVFGLIIFQRRDL